jgi:hypothetical protein
MKRLLGALVLTFGALATANALDDKRMAALETDLGGLMQNLDPASLQALDKELTPQLKSAAPEVWVRAGIVSHNLSRVLSARGVTGNAGRAVERLSAAAGGTDTELAVVALSFLGSAKALQGKEDWNPAGKILSVNDGWALLDKAVGQYGEASFLPRLLRASVAASLPDFFNKAAVGLEDLKALDTWNSAHPGRMSASVQAQVALLEGDALKKAKQLYPAIAAWKHAVALDPDKKGAGKAAAADLELYAE